MIILITSLKMTSGFIPLWSEKMHDVISIFLSLLRLILWPNMWFILEDVPWALEVNVYATVFYGMFFVYLIGPSGLMCDLENQSCNHGENQKPSRNWGVGSGGDGEKSEIIESPIPRECHLAAPWKTPLTWLIFFDLTCPVQIALLGAFAKHNQQLFY